MTNLQKRLGGNLRENLRRDLSNGLCNMIFLGQCDLCKIAVCHGLYNFINIKYKKSDKKFLNIWLNIGKSTGWWMPFENICFCFERPNILNIDNQGKLHCPNGPAMGFKDGYLLYYWHGESIPAEMIGDNIEVETKIKTWQAFKNF